MPELTLLSLIASCALLLCCCHPGTTPLEPPREFICAWDEVTPLNFLDSVSCPAEFNALAGAPIMPTLSDVQSVKVVHEIATKKTYFVASSAFRLHFDFCNVVLGYAASHAQFNNDQYGDGPQRRYYLASVNRYRASGIYALQFFADDRIPAEGIATLFDEVQKHTFFGDSIFFLANSTTLQEKVKELGGVPVVSEERIYAGQQFQALNAAIGYGYLVRVPLVALDTTPLTRHDIIVTDGVPIDLPVVAGIITAAFQTPLSHVNVLSHNRKTPNMTLRTAWSDPLIRELEGKLVRLAVSADTFELRAASIEEATTFWNSIETRPRTTLTSHDDTAGIFTLEELSHTSLHLVGAKAANLAACAKLTIGEQKFPVPEGAFAIPFYYYRKHCSDNGIDSFMEMLFADSLFTADASFRSAALQKIRDTIENAPLDRMLTYDVNQMCRKETGYTRFRFRSSTNAEDVEGFNGAGLYESHTADIGQGVASVEKAIKKVYASMWTLRGFAERDYFNIVQKSAAMGILVHRAFESEEANGVAITANIYQPYVPAYTINVQIKDISVVLPPAGFQSDQLLLHMLRPDWKVAPVVEYIAHSNVNFGEGVLGSDEVVELARWLEKIKNYFYMLDSNTELDYYVFAMDVEFKFDGPDRKLYIKQARPYTVK